MEQKTATSLTMLSAGLSLLESMNTVTSVPTSYGKDVLLSHPTMTTKGGCYSPPLHHTHEGNRNSKTSIKTIPLMMLDSDEIDSMDTVQIQQHGGNVGHINSATYASSSNRHHNQKFVHFSEDNLLREYPIGGSDSSDVCSEASSTISLKHVVVGKEYDWTEEVRRLIREEMDIREQLRKESEIRHKVSNETQTIVTKSSQVPEHAAPPRFMKPVCDCFITEGETAYFVYIIETTNPTAITWQRNGIEITRSVETPNIGIIDDDEAGCLLISDADRQHSGVYSCIAENIYGSVKCTAKLIVRPDVARPPGHEPTSFESYQRRTYKDQMSQTLEISRKNKAVNSKDLGEKNDYETGEGAVHKHGLWNATNMLMLWRHLHWFS